MQQLQKSVTKSLSDEKKKNEKNTIDKFCDDSFIVEVQPVAQPITTITTINNSELLTALQKEAEMYFTTILDCPSYLKECLNFQWILLIPYVQKHSFLLPDHQKLWNHKTIRLLTTNGKSVQDHNESWIPLKKPKFNVLWPSVINKNQ